MTDHTTTPLHTNTNTYATHKNRTSRPARRTRCWRSRRRTRTGSSPSTTRSAVQSSTCAVYVHGHPSGRLFDLTTTLISPGPQPRRPTHKTGGRRQHHQPHALPQEGLPDLHLDAPARGRRQARDDPRPLQRTSSVAVDFDPGCPAAALCLAVVPMERRPTD